MSYLMTTFVHSLSLSLSDTAPNSMLSLGPADMYKLLFTVGIVIVIPWLVCQPVRGDNSRASASTGGQTWNNYFIPPA